MAAPSDENEAQKIGTIFRNLDHLITLHQRKCAFLFKCFRTVISKKIVTSTLSWEQRKLGEMMNVTSVKRIHQSDWTDSGVRFLRARDIVAAAKNEEPDDYLYISKEKYEEYSALSGKVGVSDLLVTGVGTIGVPYLVRNLEPLYFKDGNIIWFQNSGKIDGKFLFYSFSAEQIQGFINESAGIGTVGTYTIESGKKTPISLPNQIEQARVGEFFQQLDNLITLHQRECISFTGRAVRLIQAINKKQITSSWEQRKVGEVSESYSGGTPSVGVKEYYGGQIPFIRSAEINSEITELFLTEEGLKNSSARLVAVGDILYALYGATSGEVGRARLKGAINQAILAIKPHTDYDSEYLAQWLRKSKHSIIETYLQGGQGNLSGTIVKELSVDFPSLKEQKAIGDFFRQLDYLITLHQRKPFFMKWRTSDANRNQTNRLVL